MKSIIISGSRNSKGQTATVASALAKGLVDSGFLVQTVFLPELKIERCRQCDDAGWGGCRTKGACVIDDDFESLAGKIKESDMVIFATPVYFSDLSESLRAFLDRLRRVAIHNKFTENKKAVGICVAGGGGGGSQECSDNLNYILETAGFNVVKIFPVRRQNLNEMLPVLREFGRKIK